MRWPAVLVCWILAFAPLAVCAQDDDEVARLRARVAAIETELAELRAERGNDRLLQRLRGSDWIESSAVRAGERVVERDEVVWRLADEVNSERLVLAAEVESLRLGRMSVDATREPAWIDFEYEWQGRTYVWRGLVESGYREATIALPPREYDNGTFTEPPRPTNLESTSENGVTVYRLVRREYAKTGR